VPVTRHERLHVRGRRPRGIASEPGAGKRKRRAQSPYSPHARNDSSAGYNAGVEIRHISAVGGKALAALRASGGVARLLAPSSAAGYALAASEFVWIGSDMSALHPRAVICALPPTGTGLPPGGPVRVSSWPERPWNPPAMPPGSVPALRQGARRLLTLVPQLSRPTGFGALLLGSPPSFPLDGGVQCAQALARACAADEPPAALAAALGLLGLGPGLTPSGDDYVGGAFFARSLVTPPGAPDSTAWRQAADALRTVAPRHTHPLSAALLGDLLDGLAHAALHELAFALAVGASTDRVLEAARRLASLGHSSGWDLLAGFVAGTGVVR